MNKRQEYTMDISINGRELNFVLIDQHYRENHPEMNDELILKLVESLGGRHFPIEMRKNDYEYFTAEPVYYRGRPYRLVLVMYISDDYLGVVNAFRISRSQ